MKIIVATDSFKGTISASEATEIIADEFAAKLPTSKVIKMPIADGGEGSTDCFVDALGGGYVVSTVKNCFFEDTQVKIGIVDAGETAVIEVAAAAGLSFAEGRKNPLLTTTYGVGQMISLAANMGVKRVLLCLGGSATNDLGCGAAAALGVAFLDKNGEIMLPLGGMLDEVCHIDTSGIPDSVRSLEIICLCDVKGTLTGDTGAARMFAPQKGASPEAVELLEANAIHMQEVIQNDLGIDVSDVEGGGAAGGFGAGAYAFFGAEIRSGIDEVLKVIGFENALEDCDAVVTGEGRVDAQSVTGKAISGVINAAKAKEVPVVVIGGSVDKDTDITDAAVFSTVTDFCGFEDVKDNAKENLRRTARNVATIVKLGSAAV
ncbi:MAG: glycerate kinase [Clostridia bacterium]|nr:glycerate kinase [Clostridia bacterium]